MRFRVQLDDMDIGYHTFIRTREGTQTTLRIRAEFDVKFLFIRAYSYSHENTEIWRDGCLRRIDSLTRDNGKRFEVSGESTYDSFRLTTLQTSRSLARDCVMTFAYWDPHFLTQSHLLNAQTGDYVDVEVEPIGKRRFDLADGAIVADGFRVRAPGEGLDISVWYQQQNGRWVALESIVGKGRLLKYQMDNADALRAAAPAGMALRPG